MKRWLSASEVMSLRFLAALRRRGDESDAIDAGGLHRRHRLRDDRVRQGTVGADEELFLRAPAEKRSQPRRQTRGGNLFLVQKNAVVLRDVQRHRLIVARKR